MLMKLKDGKSKVLTLSYDDGVVQDIRLIEILDKYGLRGTFNINTGRYLPEDAQRERYYGRMKLSEAQALFKGSCHEVAVHSLTHPFLETLKKPQVLMEILEDRKNIEAQYGTLARGMAYPMGTYSDMVIEAVEAAGICYSRTCKATENFKFPENWLTLHPTCHHKHPRLMELAQKFVEEKPRYTAQNWMFYLWGHSYEFDNDDNWNVIEEFAAYTGGKDDIWYATNIEIYDYIKAYESLQVSVDESIIHNPTTTDLWFHHKHQIHCIRSGETLFL